MWLYSRLSKPFPNSFRAKIFSVAFVGTHVPLLALILWLVLPFGAQLSPLVVLVVVLVATLLGTAFTFLALGEILRPLYRVEDAVRRFEEEGKVLPLPFGYRDQVGRVMSAVNRMILSVEDQIDSSRRAAETDALTGAFNRRGFDARVAEGRPGAICLLDIDDFKGINDRFGHEQGDRVLRDLASIVGTTIRGSDVFARLGGEEFAVFLPNIALGDARDAAERLRSRIAAQLRAEEDPVTVSIGVAMWRPGETRDSLLRQADRGLYAAKQSGRNRVCMAVVAQGGMTTA